MKSLHKQRGFLGDLIGGFLGFSGAEQQGDDMIRNTEIANQFSAAQMATNREFQERMSGTAYQRGTADMKAAGLNPMLAYSQGGASSPSGNAAQGIPAPTVNKLGAAVASAGQVAQIENTRAQTQKTQAETANIKAEQIERDEHGQIKGLPATYSARLQRALGEEHHHRAAHEIAKAELTVKQREEVIQHIENLKTQNKLNELNLPRAINEAKAHGTETTFGKYHPYGDATFRGINSAAQLFNMFKGR